MLPQEAQAQICAMVSNCAAAIQKEEETAHATLTKLTMQHEAKLGQHAQRMEEALAAYLAAVAAEWTEAQKTVSDQAVALQVRPMKLYLSMRHMVLCCTAWRSSK